MFVGARKATAMAGVEYAQSRHKVLLWLTK
jgi:hypothetical protein